MSQNLTSNHKTPSSDDDDDKNDITTAMDRMEEGTLSSLAPDKKEEPQLAPAMDEPGVLRDNEQQQRRYTRRQKEQPQLAPAMEPGEEVLEQGTNTRRKGQPQLAPAMEPEEELDNPSSPTTTTVQPGAVRVAGNRQRTRRNRPVVLQQNNESARTLMVAAEVVQDPPLAVAIPAHDYNDDDIMDEPATTRDAAPHSSWWSTRPCSRRPLIALSVALAIGVAVLVAVVVVKSNGADSSPATVSTTAAPTTTTTTSIPTLAPTSAAAPTLSPTSAFFVASFLWTQVGQDMDGVAEGDRSGRAVSLSADGTTVAVGAPASDANGTDAGQVRVYRLVVDDNDGWMQIGGAIHGRAAEDEFGKSVALSADGTILAVGADENDGNGESSGHVCVYRFVEEEWIQLGHDIYGEAAGDDFGISVSLSADGTTVAVGAYGNDGNGSDAGHVRVFQLHNESEWIQVGSDIDGEAADDWFGQSTCLSADGLTVAVGAPYNSGSGIYAGHVRVYRLLTGGEWMQVGGDIDGQAAGDEFGKSVSLSADGTTVAIGADESDGNGESSGHVCVYRVTDDNEWIQLGQDIYGEAAGDDLGISVSLSANGTTLAIGAYGNDGNGSNAGQARVYRLTGDGWFQLGSDIDGEASQDWFGESVSLSADGTTLAVGAPYNSANRYRSGHVRVFRLEEK